MSWTTPQNVRDFWIGEPIEATDAQLQLFINALEAQARRRLPNLEADVLLGEPDIQTIVVPVIVNAIIEYLKVGSNPYDSESQNVGEFGRSVSVSDRYRRKLRLTDEDITELSAYSIKGSAFAIDMSSGFRAYDDGCWDGHVGCACVEYVGWNV